MQAPPLRTTTTTTAGSAHAPTPQRSYWSVLMSEHLGCTVPGDGIDASEDYPTLAQFNQAMRVLLHGYYQHIRPLEPRTILNATKNNEPIAWIKATPSPAPTTTTTTTTTSAPRVTPATPQTLATCPRLLGLEAWIAHFMQLCHSEHLAVIGWLAQTDEQQLDNLLQGKDVKFENFNAADTGISFARYTPTLINFVQHLRGLHQFIDAWDSNIEISFTDSIRFAFCLTCASPMLTYLSRQDELWLSPYENIALQKIFPPLIAFINDKLIPNSLTALRNSFQDELQHLLDAIKQFDTSNDTPTGIETAFCMLLTRINSYFDTLAQCQRLFPDEFSRQENEKAQQQLLAALQHMDYCQDGTFNFHCTHPLEAQPALATRCLLPQANTGQYQRFVTRTHANDASKRGAGRRFERFIARTREKILSFRHTQQTHQALRANTAISTPTFVAGHSGTQAPFNQITIEINRMRDDFSKIYTFNDSDQHAFNQHAKAHWQAIITLINEFEASQVAQIQLSNQADLSQWASQLSSHALLTRLIDVQLALERHRHAFSVVGYRTLANVLTHAITGYQALIANFTLQCDTSATATPATPATAGAANAAGTAGAASTTTTTTTTTTSNTPLADKTPLQVDAQPLDSTQQHLLQADVKAALTAPPSKASSSKQWRQQQAKARTPHRIDALTLHQRNLTAASLLDSIITCLAPQPASTAQAAQTLRKRKLISPHLFHHRGDENTPKLYYLATIDNSMHNTFISSTAPCFIDDLCNLLIHYEYFDTCQQDEAFTKASDLTLRDYYFRVLLRDQLLVHLKQAGLCQEDIIIGAKGASVCFQMTAQEQAAFCARFAATGQPAQQSTAACL